MNKAKKKICSLYMKYFKTQNPSLHRRVANEYFKQVAKKTFGNIIHVGSRGDCDKQGSFYELYFKYAEKYETLDVEGEVTYKNDICDMKDVSSNYYDAVLCPWVLEHIEDVEGAVDEIYRILKHDGILIFSVPFNIKYHGYPDDYWRYNVQSLENLFDGFIIKDIRHVGLEKPMSLDYRLKIYPNQKPTNVGCNGFMGVVQKI